MSKARKGAQERLDKKIGVYGGQAFNLAVERHLLSTEKRSHFTIRFHSKDQEEIEECTRKMEELTIKINEIDSSLFLNYGIQEKERTEMIRDLKKVRPDDWIFGFE